ncbi:MAG: hypothetical protein FJZ98_08370 [Chloroflexi bacterium]|nr:hypothetical protein [Chloroflexota bacterium]
MKSSKRKPGYTTLNALLDRIEKLFLTVIIGLIFPILLGLTGWWGSIPFVSEDRIVLFAMGGVLAGVMVDLLYLRQWTRKALKMSILWPGVAYLFYSVGIIGFFMGVPLFNLLLGPVWGYYMGMRLRAENAAETDVVKAAHRSALFTSAVLALARIASLVIAFLDPSLEANIQGMFRLSEPMVRSMILGVSAIGGIVLVVVEYFLTRAAVKFANFT